MIEVMIGVWVIGVWVMIGVWIKSKVTNGVWFMMRVRFSHSGYLQGGGSPLFVNLQTGYT